MSEELEGFNNQSLNHFLSDSVWNYWDVMDEVTQSFCSMVGKHLNETALVIDESSFPKKGKSSVGVARQYCGQLGKVDNCQVGVFGSLCWNNLSSLVQTRLYLPKDWTSDTKRLDQCGVPEEDRGYKSKIDLAWDIISYLWKEKEIKFGWVNLDAFYGRDQSLLEKMDKSEVIYVADVPIDLQVYVKDFTLKIPENKRGRKASKERPDQKAIRIDEYIRQLKPKDWEKVDIRPGTKGKIRASFHCKKIYLFDKNRGRKMTSRLLLRKDKDGTIYASLTNSQKRLVSLAEMQCKRYFIERAFQDNKQQIGLNQYQVRKYDAWYRHMVLCMMTMQFINEEKLKNNKKLQYLTAKDIKVMLVYYLDKRQKDFETLVKDIVKKNKKESQMLKYYYG